MAITIERKYVLTKVKPGDYLLPSNDGQSLWRIFRYKDGPSYGLDWPKDIPLWGIARFSGDIGTDDIDVEDWNLWPTICDGFGSRREAIDDALLTQEA